MTKQKTIAFDLDDVLCFRDKKYEHLKVEKYAYCFPNQKFIDLANNLYKQGYRIIIYTARGMTQFAGDVEVIEANLRPITEKQLADWGVLHHKLIFGKQHYELLIDDKAMNSNEVTLEQIVDFCS